MELEACVGIHGSSEDDFLIDDIVAELLGESSQPVIISSFLSPDTIIGGVSKEGEDVLGGESKEGNEEGANRKAKSKAKLKAKVKAKVKAKKNSFKCIVCEKTFGSGQALGGHMNAHPGEKFKKIEKAYMKIHGKDSWGQDRTLDLHQQSWFQGPPNGFNLIPGPANDMPNSCTDICCNPTQQAVYQQALQDQVYWDQSYPLMAPNAQVGTPPSWNAPGSSSQADVGFIGGSCSDPCCNPAPSTNYEQATQYQEWSQSNSMMPLDVQDLTTSTLNVPSTSQPYFVYNDSPFTRPYCDPALQVMNYQQTGQNQDWSHDAQSYYRDPNAQNFFQDPNAQNFY